jgi:dihydrolipoamide dehydrogenase
VERAGDQVEIDYQSPGGEPRTERFDYVLAATGRVPNVDKLGLEPLALERDARGVPTFDRNTAQSRHVPDLHRGRRGRRYCRCYTKRPTKAASPARTPRSSRKCSRPRRAPLGIVFTDPQIAIVGRGFAALKAHASPPARSRSRTRAARA